MLYGAHAKQTACHVMVTAAGTQELEALQKLSNIIFLGNASAITAALRAGATTDPTSGRRWISTRFAHYALSDEGYKTCINDFAANRYPFSTSDKVVMSLKGLCYKTSQALEVTREDHKLYGRVREAKLMTSELRNARPQQRLRRCWSPRRLPCSATFMRTRRTRSLANRI